MPDGRVQVIPHYRAYMTPMQEFCPGGFAAVPVDLAP
jgi:hypothetical protein